MSKKALKKTIVGVENTPINAVIEDDTISFYDARYRHTKHGQLIQQYYIKTIINCDSGLDLMCHVPAWKIGPYEMKIVTDWLKELKEKENIDVEK